MGCLVSVPRAGRRPQVEVGRYDYSDDFRKTLTLYGSQIVNRCVRMRATAVKTPFGGTDLYSADYFYGGSAGADEEH
jgi:hypothetical protein